MAEEQNGELTRSAEDALLRSEEASTQSSANQHQHNTNRSSRHLMRGQRDERRSSHLNEQPRRSDDSFSGHDHPSSDHSSTDQSSSPRQSVVFHKTKKRRSRCYKHCYIKRVSKALLVNNAKVKNIKVYVNETSLF